MKTKERIYLFTFLFSFCTFIISPSILVLLEEHQDIAYYFNVAEEEESKEEGKEKEMNESFVLQSHDLDIGCLYAEYRVFFHLQPMEDEIFLSPVLPPPEFIS